VLQNTLISNGRECDKTAQRPTVQIEVDPNRLCAPPDQIVYTLAQTRRPALERQSYRGFLSMVPMDNSSSATSRRLSPSKSTSCRTVAYSSTPNILGSSLPDSEKADPPMADFYAALRRQNGAAPLADFATALKIQVTALYVTLRTTCAAAGFASSAWAVTARRER
jgi:hypothetical protein